MRQCMGCMEVYQDNLSTCPYCGYRVGTMPENTLHMEPGSILNNRYVVGKVIGYGGFGVTYLAWDSLLEQKVAIKEFLPSEFATRMLGRLEITIFSGDKETQFLEGLYKFVDEAKKIAKFNNVPGIVKIYDCIEENNTAYIIMEYLEGETLATKLEREKKMSADEAITLLLPVMESLNYVNGEGVIHRDIAPDNIFITKKHGPKLIDFGAARYATTSLSRSLTIIIKPGYSPEEQYRSMADQGSWTDVYSIGATLYRMITGEVPCDSMERRASMEQYGVDLLKPLSKYTNRISKNQETAILNAMNTRIEDRTPNMAVLIDELNSVTDVKRVEMNVDKASRLSRILDVPVWVKIACLIAVLGLVVFVGFIGIKSSSKELFIEKGMTRVPNLLNLSFDDAIKELKKNNLSYKVIGYIYSASMPADYVIFQEKSVGDVVKENYKIPIKISKEKPIRDMSYVIAMNVNKAKKLLERDGYTVSEEEIVYSKNIAKDCIVTQEADTEGENKAVKITVSQGAENGFINGKTDVPNFQGEQFTKVLQMALDSNLMIEVVKRAPDTEHQAGEVLSQSVRGGVNVKNGTVVQIEVSDGTDEITLEGITEFKIEEAKQMLEEQGLVVEDIYEINPNYDRGIVFEQSPEPGTKLKTGDTVTLKVSVGESEEFEMINIYGLTQADAIQELKKCGLQYKVKKGYTGEVDENCVYMQSIGEGEIVKVGDTIEITVSSTDLAVTVPDIIGKQIEEGKSILANAKLEFGDSGVFNENVPKGQIMSVLPKVGTRVSAGDTIDVIYSKGVGIQVQDVNNKNYIDAKNILASQGFNVKYDYKFDDAYYGRVIGQSIAGGESAGSGDSIVLTVSLGRPSIEFEKHRIDMSVGQEIDNIIVKCAPVDGSFQVNVSPEYKVKLLGYGNEITNNKEIYKIRLKANQQGKAKLVVSLPLINGEIYSQSCTIHIN